MEIANTQFTYLRDTAARVEVAMGDGRLVLDSEPDQHFDILVMDAFSGDSVPVHLITREAFRTYFRHLKPGGILAVNISNKYLRLDPVMERAASAFGKLALVYHYTPPEDDALCFSCSWTLIMDRGTAAAHPELEQHGTVLQPRPASRVWTDDFSNMFRISEVRRALAVRASRRPRRCARSTGPPRDRYWRASSAPDGPRTR